MSDLTDHIRAGLPPGEEAEQVINEVAELEAEVAEARMMVIAAVPEVGFVRQDVVDYVRKHFGEWRDVTQALKKYDAREVGQEATDECKCD